LFKRKSITDGVNFYLRKAKEQTETNLNIANTAIGLG
jgi:hypothetical protein